MVGVVFDASNIVVKDGLCLGKGDSMLAEVRPLFVSVPIEGGSQPRGSSPPFPESTDRHHSPGMTAGDMLSKEIGKHWLISGTFPVPFELVPND